MQLGKSIFGMEIGQVKRKKIIKTENKLETKRNKSGKIVLLGKDSCDFY
jgi:hypothetical protein